MELSTQRLRIFLAVADTVHFGRAAERLRISQPSVSQQVARLERDLGCQLFDRAPGGVTLTAAGRDLVALVGTALRGLDSAVEAFVKQHREHGRLRVGLLSSLAGELVTAAVASLDLEGTELQLAEGSLAMVTEQLRRGEVDVVFCYDTGDPGVLTGLKVQVLDRRSVVVALPGGDPLAGCAELSWTDLAARPWIVPSASRHYRDDMVQRFGSRGLSMRIVAEATTLTGQLALVAAGIGLTFTSPWAGVPSGVVIRPVGAPREEISLLAVQASDEVAAITEALVAAVREQASARR